MNIIKHSWQDIPGFKKKQCEKCGCIQRWDPARGMIVFDKDVHNIGLLRRPKCIALIHSQAPMKLAV